MKKLLFISMFGLVLLGSAGLVRAEDPYAYISLPKKSANLGTILVWDTIIPEVLTLKVHSNCLHGPVVASMSDLRHRRGNLIKTDRIFIKTAYTGGFVSMEKPVMISGQAFGSHDIVIDFKIKNNGLIDRSGKYSGTIAFTIIPPV